WPPYRPSSAALARRVLLPLPWSDSVVPAARLLLPPPLAGPSPPPGIGRAGPTRPGGSRGPHRGGGRGATLASAPHGSDRHRLPASNRGAGGSRPRPRATPPVSGASPGAGAPPALPSRGPPGLQPWGLEPLLGTHA